MPYGSPTALDYLLRLLRLSGKRGFNIETFSAELHRGQGTFHLVVDKVAVAKETFMENRWEATEENVASIREKTAQYLGPI